MPRASRWEGCSGPGLARRLDLPAAEVHGTLRSTNLRARELARDGCEAFTLVVADRQTSGRGRGGRTWHSPAGCGVWASLVVSSGGADVDGVLPVRLGLALAARLEAVSEAAVRLKWPNDLFLDDGVAVGKVGGILCERVPTGAGPGSGAATLVVGVGLNVLPVDAGAEYPTAAMIEAGQGDRYRVLECVVAAVRTACSDGATRLNPDEREAWRVRDLLSGRAVQVMGPSGGRERGIARGIDGRGRLLVESASGLTPVVGGTVRPLEPIAGGASRCSRSHGPGIRGP